MNSIIKLKKFMAFALVCVMLLGVCPLGLGASAAGAVAKELPKAEDITVDLDDYYGQKIEGYYNFNCYVSETVTRTAKFYVPANTVFNQPTVLIGVPNDVDTWDFLVDSGWKDLADDKGLHIVLMEPVDGKWGNAEDEVAYINALNEDVSFRPFFCAFSSNFYGVGYGEAADLLQQHSVNKPKSWASIALLGASGMTAEQVTALEGTASKVPGVSLAEAQTPVWIVAKEKSDDITRLVDFYKSSNHSNAKKSSDTYASEVYLPKDGGTIDDPWCANVVYDTADWEAKCVNKTYSAKIYTELFEGTYRYPGNANGALRRPGEIFARGFEKFEAKVAGGFDKDGSDLYNREWYVYEPDSVKGKKDVPLVFVFHGAGGSGNEIADRSGWASVAEEKGFIIVMPTGSIEPSVRNVSDMTTNEYFRAMWNTGDATETRPSDLQFVEYLHNWMQEKYNIDTTRVYASGQSSGGMMTWACAAKLPELFTAVAPISAYNTPDPIGTSLVPIACYMGEEETTFKGGFAADTAKSTIQTWTSLYNTVENWGSYVYMDDSADKYSSQEGLFTNYVYNTYDGVPMIRAIEVATKTHAIWPSECFDAWDNWFVNYTKDADGTLYYKGEKVEIDDGQMPFTDSTSHWAKEAIQYVYYHEIMNGTSATTFAPDADTTRGMIVTMLYRLSGSPEITSDSHFTDVSSDAYYSDPVVWAAANGIVNGTSSTTFAPNASITREQLATMLYNYSKFAKYSVSANAKLDSFSDADDVSAYAVDSLQWAVGAELVTGIDATTLSPAGTATRAQVATMFYRYMENIAE